MCFYSLTITRNKNRFHIKRLKIKSPKDTSSYIQKYCEWAIEVLFNFTQESAGHVTFMALSLVRGTNM